MLTYQNEQPVEVLRVLYGYSAQRLLTLFGEFQGGLDDAITLDQLKSLCEAIRNEIETFEGLRNRIAAIEDQ
jgi:hypothetical protein